MTYGITTNIVLPLVTDSQQYIALGLVTVDIFAVGLALSIIRHRFLDIRSYVFRAAVYILTLFCVAAIYVGAASLLSTQILHITLPSQSLLVLSLITLLVAASFQPLRTSFDHLTNRLFFRDYYSPQDVLDKLGDLLVGTVDVDEIKRGSQQLLKEAFNPTSLSYALHSAAHMVKVDQIFLDRLLESDYNVVSPFDIHPHQYDDIISGLKKRDIALAVRLRTKHGDLGYIMLGFRQSGADYSYADRKFIGVIADQLAIGLQNALRFEEIEKFNRTLQEKIAEATKKLRHSNDKLRTLDQTKDDFISMASHQLRTPLTSVKGYVSMVLDGDAGSITPLQRKLLNQSFISSQRMVYLISDLLNVSRLRTGKFIIEPTPTNLATIIHEEVEQLTETAKSRNLSLMFNRPEHFPHIMLDETKIRQVIMNFVDNAIYYTPSGGRIVINLLDKPESVEFTVTDNGIGVPKAEQHHLFSKFYRAPNAKRARPDGTGLGLFMAKKVVIAQGGAVVFKSQEGKGSTFGFTFAKSHVAVPEKLAHTVKTP
jgi:signal transduction histidine kinase